MTADIPKGLQAEVRNAVCILIEAARHEGWTIREVRIGNGVVSVSAASPAGGFHLACVEEEFLDRLRMLLKAKSDPYL
jgi:hypothetical protein